MQQYWEAVDFSYIIRASAEALPLFDSNYRFSFLFSRATIAWSMFLGITQQPLS
jgi:hypothetical protein